MLNVLWQILCAIKNGFMSILALVVMAFNAIVAAIAAAIEELLDLLPEFPDPLGLPSPLDEVLGWINWVFPVGEVIEILAWAAVAWLAWQAVATALRWAKVIE